MTHKQLTRKRKKPLGRLELVAVALGGMIGGGIFAVLGVAVSIVGKAAPLAIFLGGVLAFFATYSYAKLAVYYKDEGATYSFFKRTFSQSHFAASIIGWLVVFGYISTLALYAFTFASYFTSVFPSLQSEFGRNIVAGSVILAFALINILSVKGMGVIEDLMVYTKIAILLVISVLFIQAGDLQAATPEFGGDFSLFAMVIVASITFVAYEGFQLVIGAYKETDNPDKNVPSAMYLAVASAALIYLVLAVGAESAIPTDLLIRDKEFALAAGAKSILGTGAQMIIILGALLATSSAISGTLFGASRLMAVISDDGFLPAILSRRRKTHIPTYAIITMAALAYLLILSGGLQTILEFGSITFIIVSFLMAFANFKLRRETQSRTIVAVISMVGLAFGMGSILYYEATTSVENLIYTGIIYALLVFLSTVYARIHGAKMQRGATGG